ncbi:MAG: T9SS type A sorting domain-containing protein [Ignavibacteria bacterium]|nr:T9SS type A sorting domain-containing protein [Ignavibacteria bacterium]
MKANKYILFFIAVFIITLFVYAFPYGFVGTTKKPGSTVDGCVCHGASNTPSVSVSIIGPDSVQTGTTATFTVRVQGGPSVNGGFNVAAFNGDVNIVPGDTMVRKQDGELTHTHPKPFSAGLVSWNFRYTAPNSPGTDTLYATGNSCNNDNLSDGDLWNWSPNRPVRIYNPIGIINISEVAEKFTLSQNYPNPFNPSTTIEFSIAEKSEVIVRVYDISGKTVSVPVNEILPSGVYKVNFSGESLSSGIYFYSLIADGRYISSRKMLLVK